MRRRNGKGRLGAAAVKIESALGLEPGFLEAERMRDLSTVPQSAVEQLQAWLKSGEIDEAEAEQIVERRRERRKWKEELGDE